MKKYLIGFILGAIIFGGIGTVLAYSVFARNIGFTPTDTTWKKSNGDNIDNVEDALNELYTSTFKKVVLNTFGNPLS